MTLTQMYDSTTPEAIPLGRTDPRTGKVTPTTLVAPYRDGDYAWPVSELVRFAHVRQLGITVQGDPYWPVFDLEHGCCTTTQVVAGLRRRRAAGKASIVYCNKSSWAGAWAQLRMAGLQDMPSYWWIAAFINQPDGMAGPPTVLPSGTLMGDRASRYASVTLQPVAWQYYGGPDGTFDVSVVDMDRLPVDLKASAVPAFDEACTFCGEVMVPAGSCLVCLGCGETSGCS